MTDTNLPPAPESVTIAIDFDRTWTVDPFAWRTWYDFMTSRGHRILLATGRQKWSDDMARCYLPDDMEIVYCGREPKAEVMAQSLHKIDIWIDDAPGAIGFPSIFLREGEV